MKVKTTLASEYLEVGTADEREHSGCLPFWVWVTSLNIIFSNSIHFPTISCLQFSPVLYSLPLHAHYIFTIQSSVEEHFGCFHFLVIVNREAIDTAEHLRSRGSSPLGTCQRVL